MKILRALRFPLRRPLRLAALALAQSLFLWLLITAVDVSGRWPNDLESIAILALFFGAPLCNAFWLFGSSVASLRRALAGQTSLAAQRASHFKPRGIGPAIASLVLIVYFALFLALAGISFQVSNIAWRLRVITPDEAPSVIASHVLIIGLGTLVSLIFFVSLACHAAADVGLHIGGSAPELFHPRKNLAATIRYLLRQFLLLGIAAIAFNLGLKLVDAITPSDLGVPLVDPLSTTWWVFVTLVSCAVAHYFWHASLYLLADYVLETS